MNSLSIALVQMESRVGDVAGNLTAMKRIMRAAKEQGAQIVLFPEASLTGYSSARAAEIALLPSCAQVRELFDLADFLGIAVCFGFFERAESGEVLIAQPLHTAGATLWHRKTHLGKKEQATIQPGQTLETIDVCGVRVGVQVCWETHFSELSTIQRMQGAEVVLMPFASGMSGQARRDSWLKYLPARASDNGMFVLACNALLDPAETESPTARGGGMLALDPRGEVIGEYFKTDECVFLCDVDGALPRDAPEWKMGNPSFFDGRRSEFFARYL